LSTWPFAGGLRRERNFLARSDKRLPEPSQDNEVGVERDAFAAAYAEGFKTVVELQVAERPLYEGGAHGGDDD
jgi:hypothetical protein